MALVATSGWPSIFLPVLSALGSVGAKTTTNTHEIDWRNKKVNKMDHFLGTSQEQLMDVSSTALSRMRLSVSCLILLVADVLTGAIVGGWVCDL